MGQSFLGLCGYTMSKRAAIECLRECRMSINDVDVIEVHDCFAPNEVSLLSVGYVCTYMHVHVCIHACVCLHMFV